MVNVALKDVKKEVWLEFKRESIKHGKKMGEFFEEIVISHKKTDNSNAWGKILKSKGILNSKEAEILKAEMQNFRKGVNFRDL